MGKPSTLVLLASEFIGCKSERGELKHLSTLRKRNRRDSVSSGERTRISPNSVCVKAYRRCILGVVGAYGVAVDAQKSYKVSV